MPSGFALALPCPAKFLFAKSFASINSTHIYFQSTRGHNAKRNKRNNSNDNKHSRDGLHRDLLPGEEQNTAFCDTDHRYASLYGVIYLQCQRYRRYNQRHKPHAQFYIHIYKREQSSPRENNLYLSYGRICHLLHRIHRRCRSLPCR